MSSEDVINDPLRTMVVLGSFFGSTSSVSLLPFFMGPFLHIQTFIFHDGGEGYLGMYLKT